MREIRISHQLFADGKLHRLAAIFDDPLGTNKFSYVRKLVIRLNAEEEINRLFGFLVLQVVNVKDLKVSADDLVPAEVWENFAALRSVKRLKIVGHAVPHFNEWLSKWFRVDAGALPFHRLLQIANEWDHLEGVHVDFREALTESEGGLLPTIVYWAEAFAMFPALAPKLAFLTITNEDIRACAQLNLCNVSRALYWWGEHFNEDGEEEDDQPFFKEWNAVDAFPGLKELTVDV